MYCNFKLKYTFLLTNFICIFLLSCSNSYKLKDYSSKNYQIKDNLSTSNFSEIPLDKYRLNIEKEMNKVLNSSLVPMEIGCPEGKLGNFISDLTFTKAISYSELDPEIIRPDLCVLNNGGLRTSLPKGKVTRGKIFEIMPFDNQLVILELEPKDMHALVSYIKNKSMIEDSRKAGVPISGMRIRIYKGEVTRVFIGTKEIDPEKNYHVVTTDYLASGGDKMIFFKNAVKTYNTGILLRDAIINHIIDLDNQNILLNAALDGRIENGK